MSNISYYYALFSISDNKIANSVVHKFNLPSYKSTLTLSSPNKVVAYSDQDKQNLEDFIQDRVNQYTENDDHKLDYQKYFTMKFDEEDLDELVAWINNGAFYYTLAEVTTGLTAKQQSDIMIQRVNDLIMAEKLKEDFNNGNTIFYQRIDLNTYDPDDNVDGLTYDLLKYIAVNTTVDEEAANSDTHPSNAGISVLGDMIVEDLIAVGVTNAAVVSSTSTSSETCPQCGQEIKSNEPGYYFVTASIDANVTEDVPPTIGFIAQLDTNYDPKFKEDPKAVKTLQLDQYYIDTGIDVLSKAFDQDERDLWNKQGAIVPDSKSILGLKAKAGSVELVDLARYLIKNPDMPHGKINFCFIADAELGNAMEYIDQTPFSDTKLAFFMNGEGQNTIQYSNEAVREIVISFTGTMVNSHDSSPVAIHALKTAIKVANVLLNPTSTIASSLLIGDVYIASLTGDFKFATLIIELRDMQDAALKDRYNALEQTLQVLTQYQTSSHVHMDIISKDLFGNKEIEIPESMITLAKNSNYNVYGRAITVIPVQNGTNVAKLVDKNIPVIQLATGGYNLGSGEEVIPVSSLYKVRTVLSNIVSGAYDPTFIADFAAQTAHAGSDPTAEPDDPEPTPDPDPEPNP